MNSVTLPFLLVLVGMLAGRQAAPISGSNSIHENSNTTMLGNSTNNNCTIGTNVTITNASIPQLKHNATRQILAIYQEIQILEAHTEERYNLFHQNCYVRFEPTDNVNVSTLKDDVKSLCQLVSVIKDLETDEVLQGSYEQIVNSIESSIVALVNLIAALEKNATADKEEDQEKDAGSDSSNKTEVIPTESTEVKLTGSPANNTKGITFDKEVDDHCEQLDKAVKLSALKLQVQLTYEDILAVGPKSN